MKKTKGDNRKVYPLRLSPEVYAAITEIAVKEHRTFNSQVAHVLEAWLKSLPDR